MLHSALNFAVGFFGLPIEGKYLQSVTIEEKGVRNTLLYHFVFAKGWLITEHFSITILWHHTRPVLMPGTEQNQIGRYLT